MVIEEIKDDTNTRKEHSMFLDWKYQYCQMGSAIEGNLQNQCNPCQITNGISLERNKKIIEFYGDTKESELPKQS